MGQFLSVYSLLYEEPPKGLVWAFSPIPASFTVFNSFYWVFKHAAFIAYGCKRLLESHAYAAGTNSLSLLSFTRVL